VKVTLALAMDVRSSAAQPIFFPFTDHSPLWRIGCNGAVKRRMEHSLIPAPASFYGRAGACQWLAMERWVWQAFKRVDGMLQFEPPSRY